MPETKGYQTVAVTGGSGFIGSHLISHLRAQGWRVKALARRNTGRPDAENITWIAGDLADHDALASLAKDVDAVIHCAGATAGRTQADFDRTNVDGTAAVAAAAAGQTVPPKIILLSSLAAREPHLSAYAASKRQGETTLQDKDLPWTVVRAPAVYGPGDRATLPLFRMFARGLALRPSWDGQFSLIYVDDLAAALTDLIAAAAATAPLELDDGHPGGHRWDDLKIVAEQLMGRRIRTLPVTPGLVHLAARATQMTSRLTGKISVFGPEKVREMIHPDWVSRSPKVDEICTWQPNIDLHQGFERTIAWYRKHLWL